MTKLDNTFHTHLLSLADTAAGFSASEVTGFSPEQVRRAAEALTKAGRIVRAKVSPRRVRYFANQRLADAYTASKAHTARPSVAGGSRSKATWRPDEPGLITPRTKIYVAPPLPQRVYRTNTYLQF